MAEFKRFTETLDCKKELRVVRASVRLLVSDCTGRVWFTDLMFQEGDQLTGYTSHTEELSAKRESLPVFFNGIVRGEATIIYPNTGTDSAGLDVTLFVEQDVPEGRVSISHQNGAQKMVFGGAVKGGDTLSLLASSRQCLRNGRPIPKDGFYQYAAAGDNRHAITLGKGVRANLLVEFQEMQERGGRF